jgi:hypothetical protein
VRPTRITLLLPRRRKPKVRSRLKTGARAIKVHLRRAEELVETVVILQASRLEGMVAGTMTMGTDAATVADGQPANNLRAINSKPERSLASRVKAMGSIKGRTRQ